MAPHDPRGGGGEREKRQEDDVLLGSWVLIILFVLDVSSLSFPTELAEVPPSREGVPVSLQPSFVTHIRTAFLSFVTST